MKDINEAFGEAHDDFGLARHGSELDDPEAGMKPGFKKLPLSSQLMKILDSRSNPNPIKSVQTDDGKEVPMSANMAKALLALLRGQIGNMKPMARERLTDKLQQSAGLEMVMKAKTGEQLIANAEELIGMGDMDRQKDKSIY